MTKWLRDLNEGDFVQFARGEEIPEVATVEKASFRFLYVRGLKFSRQTGKLSGSDKLHRTDAKLMQADK